MNNKIIAGYFAILTALIAFLLYKQYTLSPQISQNTISPKNPSIPKTEAQFAYVNLDSLNSQYKWALDIRDEAEREKKSIENSYVNQVNGWQKQYQELERSVASLSSDQIDRKKYELAELEKKIIEDRELKSQNLMEKFNDKNNKLVESLNNYIKKYNSDGKYRYIFSYQKNSNILYADSSDDITKEIINGLNEEYLKSKGK